MPTNTPSPEMNLADFKLEGGTEKPQVPPEAGTEKGPKPGALELAGTISSDMSPNKPKAELVIERINDILGLSKKDEKGPDLKTDTVVASKNENPNAKPAEFTDADFAGLADYAKP